MGHQCHMMRGVSIFCECVSYRVTSKQKKNHEHVPVRTRYDHDAVFLLPRLPPGSPAPTAVSEAASALHNVLLLLRPPLLIHCSDAATMYVWLLSCSAAAFPAAATMPGICFCCNPREHGKYASQPLSMICLRIPAEIRTNLLRKLYEYRLAIGIFLMSRRRSRASVVFVWDVHVRYTAGGCCYELAAPT